MLTGILDKNSKALLANFQDELKTFSFTSAMKELPSVGLELLNQEPASTNAFPVGSRLGCGPQNSM